MTAAIANALLNVIGGAVATLFGFRYLGPKPGVNEKYDAQHRKWLKHLKWLGPLGIAFAVIQLVFSLPTLPGLRQADLRRNPERGNDEKQIILRQDLVFESAEGFGILLPAGYTYSTSRNSSRVLLAVNTPGGVAVPVISVSVMTSNASSEDFLSNLQAGFVGQNRTTTFSSLTRIRNGNTDVIRVTMTALRDNSLVVDKVNVLVATRGERHYVAMVGTRDDLYAERAAELERVVASFRLR